MKLLSFFNRLLETAGTSDNNFAGTGLEKSGLDNIVNTIVGIINSIVAPVLIIVATVGIIYAIVLGVNYARAETTEDKENAKKRVINVVVAMVIMVVLMLLLWLFAANATTIVGWIQGFGAGGSSTSGAVRALFVR